MLSRRAERAQSVTVHPHQPRSRAAGHVVVPQRAVGRHRPASRAPAAGAPPAGSGDLHIAALCLIAMEASSGAHHWALKLVDLGLDARIIAAHLVEPYRSQGKSGKNDANDAAAICEAASRPSMRFVAIKTVDQQSMLSVHRLREGLKEERTACSNRIRGLLAEFGVVIAKSTTMLRERLSEVIEDADNELSGLNRLVIERAQTQWKELDAHIVTDATNALQRTSKPMRKPRRLRNSSAWGLSAPLPWWPRWATSSNSRTVPSLAPGWV